jgi:predicted DNA-binding transcriptional regulator AlpA
MATTTERLVRWLKKTQVAEMVSMSTRSIDTLMKTRGFPRPINLNPSGQQPCWRWSEAEVTDWINGLSHRSAQ